MTGNTNEDDNAQYDASTNLEEGSRANTNVKLTNANAIHIDKTLQPRTEVWFQIKINSISSKTNMTAQRCDNELTNYA